MYIADGGDHRVYEITLGSNFDLTGSATHSGTLATNITNGSGTPCGLTFNNDGSKLFLAWICATKDFILATRNRLRH